jgi:predicted transcriptional regulator
MGRTPHETVQIEDRRRQVSELYLRGWSQADIARQLSVSQATISSDLKTIREEWRQSAIWNYDEAVSLARQQLDLLEREAWSGYQRSQQPAESTKVVQNGSDKRAEKTVKQQPGDPRFLETIHRVIAARRALLGLDAPARVGTKSVLDHEVAKENPYLDAPPELILEAKSAMHRLEQSVKHKRDLS